MNTNPPLALASRDLTVIQMHGQPGSGKSTLARALGRALHVIVLDKDLFKSALLDAGIGADAAGPAAYGVYFAVAATLLAQHRSLVLDNPVFWPDALAHSRRVAAAAGARYRMIECVCPDQRELARRLQSRDAMPSQPRTPLDLAQYPGAAAVTAGAERLTLDTTRPFHQILAEALAYVRERPAALASGPRAAAGIR